jgi:hypothetical protein
LKNNFIVNHWSQSAAIKYLQANQDIDAVPDFTLTVDKNDTALTYEYAVKKELLKVERGLGLRLEYHVVAEAEQSDADEKSNRRVEVQVAPPQRIRYTRYTVWEDWNTPTRCDP